MFVFNTLEVDREYTLNDLKKILPVNDPKYNLENGFYGGVVTHIGETGGDVLLLINNGNGLRLVDTGAMTLDNIPTKIIRSLCLKRKYITNKDKFTSREKMLEMLGVIKRDEKENDGKPKDDDARKRNVHNDGRRKRQKVQG